MTTDTIEQILAGEARRVTFACLSHENIAYTRAEYAFLPMLQEMVINCWIILGVIPNSAVV